MSTWSFLEAMMMFPDVQAEAQAEIDKLVGTRIPVWEDFERSPYFRCMMKEVWRWRPPVSLGHPHTTTRDTEYKGMRIPKGSRLHLNAWAIHHDPQRHEDPDRFWPQRYTGDTNTTQQSINLADPTKRDHFAFGVGRRACPGMHVAERSLALAMMRILWSFNVGISSAAKLPLNPKDYHGFMPGNPGEELPAILTVRTEEKRQLIDEAWATSESEKASFR
jgi:cytochrome P450